MKLQKTFDSSAEFRICVAQSAQMGQVWRLSQVMLVDRACASSPASAAVFRTPVPPPSHPASPSHTLQVERWFAAQLFRAMEDPGQAPKALVKDWNIERQNLESCFLKIVKDEYASI